MNLQRLLYLVFCLLYVCSGFAQHGNSVYEKISDEVRAKQIADMKFGMFVCWSFSTFSGKEWTGDSHGPDFFQAKSCDTDQWARVAKEAGMKYIYILSKNN